MDLPSTFKGYSDDYMNSEDYMKLTYVEYPLKTLSIQNIKDTASLMGIPKSIEDHIPTFLEYVETAVSCFVNSKKYEGYIVSYTNFYEVAGVPMVYWIHFSDTNGYLARKKSDEKVDYRVSGHKCLLYFRNRDCRYKDMLGKRALVAKEKLPLLINHESQGVQIFSRYKLQCRL